MTIVFLHQHSVVSFLFCIFATVKSCQAKQTYAYCRSCDYCQIITSIEVEHLQIAHFKLFSRLQKNFREKYASKYTLPQGYMYAICLKKDNFPIGYIKVDIDEPHDFGYGLRK